MAQKWTLKGRIVVDHVLPELAEAFGAREGLPGVTVKVSARSKIPFGWGWWRSWGKVVTDRDGNFKVTKNRGGDRRQFKIKVLFDSDRLRLKQGQETKLRLDTNGFPLDVDLTDLDWFEIHNDDKVGATNGRKAGVIDLGSVPVIGDTPKKLADMWSLYNRVMDLMASYGPEYAFTRRVVGKYPMGLGKNNPNSSSYNNPATRSLYIKEDQFHARILLEELCHQWDFDRSTGEDAMAWQLLKHGTTHQLRENTTYVAFREAFADWFGHVVMREITGGKILNFENSVVWKYPFLPLTRAYVGAALGETERVIANVDYTARGWHSLFNILTHPALDKCDFNRPLTENDPEYCFVSLFTTEACPEVRTGYDLKQVLSIWLKHPAKGIDSFMGNKDLDFRRFLARAGAILPGFEVENIRTVKQCLNPNTTKNPCLAA
ncbi:MAG: hypothetical protein AAFX81_06445 [Pseudomonadota bacterium]